MVGQMLTFVNEPFNKHAYLLRILTWSKIGRLKYAYVIYERSLSQSRERVERENDAKFPDLLITFVAFCSFFPG